jgi:hypothetical protein
MNQDLGGSTVDRFIENGAAASRGTRVSSILSPAATITKDEAYSLLVSESDLFSSVKESMNQAVVSELVALERQAGSLDADMLLPRTLSDMIEGYKMYLCTWYRALLVHLFVMMSGTSMDIS